MRIIGILNNFSLTKALSYLGVILIVAAFLWAGKSLSGTYADGFNAEENYTSTFLFDTFPTPSLFIASVDAPEYSGELYGLGFNTVIEESGSMNESADPYWWVNSGGYFMVSNGVGRTVVGDIRAGDKWAGMYSLSNPSDTDNGLHPQNIFRLITKSVWKNAVQEGYFYISRYNLSTSRNRAGYNGIFFLNRYVDGQNLYYAGIRTDGKAVIKKKINGKYFTLDISHIYPGIYDRTANPNLIPENRWIGIRTELQDNPNGTLSINVYIDKDGNGNWQYILGANDDGLKYGPVIKQKSFAGIRTDFMDVFIRNYKIREK